MIGSHNTMTFLKPRKAWMYLLLPFARCQTSRETALKVDCLDIRIKRLSDGRWCFAHGLCDFGKSSIDWLHIAGLITAWWRESGARYVRMTLETSKPDAVAEVEFIKICAFVEDRTKDLAECFGGTRKFDWKRLYDFGNNPRYEQCIGSMRSKYGKVLPWLWSLLNCHRRAAELAAARDDNEVITLFDYL